MLCDVVLALVVTFSDGSKQVVQRHGAPISAVKGEQDELAKVMKDPANAAQLIKNNISNMELEVRKQPKPFPCDVDPEAKPEGK